MSVRINGLVRAYTRMQSRLRDGIAPDEVAGFRREVETLIQQVEAICRRHSITPNQLPGPSQRVYRFLKDLDLTALPLREADTPSPAIGTIRLANLVAIGGRLADQLWHACETLESDAAQREPLDEIAGHVRDVERLCVRRGLTPAALAAPSRTVYCWLKFLADPGNFKRHLQALRRAQRAVRSKASRPAPSIAVHLTNTSTLWRIRGSRTEVLLTVNEGFLAADDDIWSALVRRALGSGAAAARQAIESFAASEEFSSVLFELDSLASPPSVARGRFHDLDASFDRVNAAYFGGRIARPALRWSTVPTSRKFGHYQTAHDTVMLSVSLDAATVPDFVVDFVMHHELLHKQLGTTIANGRRSVHGPAFRAAEQRYTRYAEAEAFLHSLARSL